MKKSYFIILIFFFSQYASQAQENLGLGVKGGMNISDYTGRGFGEFKSDSYTSFHVGLFIQFSLSSRWNVQPELLYSEQGFGLKNNSQENIQLKLNYLQLPVLLEFQLIKGLFLQSGPQLSYLLKEDYNAVSYRLNYNTFDFSVGFGVEYRLQSFFLYGRYNTGINRIFNSSEVQAHNRVIQAGVGFFL